MSPAADSGAADRDARILLTEFAALQQDDPRRIALRDELVTMHLPLVRHLAGRYRDRGEPIEDLVQAGTVGLIMAIDRFDPARGTELATYATPTILGEIRRHFRDHAWAIRVPRGLQELNARVSATVEELTARLSRAPTVREIAEAMDVRADDVLAALEARHAYSPDTIDEGPDGAATIADAWGGVEPAFAAIEDRESLLPLLAALPAREQQILRLRFVDGMSQAMIAERLGISQMHVSRLLARSLTSLREGLADDGA